MTKFLLGIIATLLLTLTFFIYKHNRTLQDLEHEKYKNLSLESKLQDSNNALEKIQLDTQSYLKGRDKEIQQIQNKYTKLLQEHTRQERALQQANIHSLPTENRHVSDITYSQYDVDVSPSSQHDVCFLSQYDKKHFSYKEFLNKSNSTHNDTQHNLSYSEIPNNSNSNSNSFQNGNTCMLSLQHCQLQMQTAKTMLQQALQ